jgi:hypothetical protein
MNTNESQSKPLAYAIETTPGVSHIFSDPETLANMVDIYEECGYPIFPTLLAQEINGQFSFIITNIRIHASSNDLLPLEEFFYYREQNDVSVWSWHLIPGTGKSKGQFVWRFPKGQDMNLRGPVLSIHNQDADDASLFGTPDDMEHLWEMYRSFGKIPVRTDYTGENISCMVIPLADMDPLRSLVAEKGETKLLATLEYKEYYEIFEEPSMVNNQNWQEDESSEW